MPAAPEGFWHRAAKEKATEGGGQHHEREWIDKKYRATNAATEKPMSR
jgi:hypothetical protein